MILEVITGTMYSGKTNLFIKRVKELEEEGKEVIVVKPIQDSRYAKNDIVSHTGLSLRGIAIDDIGEISELVEEGCDVLAIDEVQFFETWDLVDFINEIVDRGVHVIVAGLNMDFRGKPYGIMPMLMASADVLTHKNGLCSVCGMAASRSQRLVNGKPASINDPIYVVSEDITYVPRCREHHQLRD